MILLFVGAGGSAAVDPEQYPVARRFFEKLPAEITNHGLYEPLRQFVSREKDEKEIDIEDLIGVLDEFQAQYKIMTDSRTFMGWVIQGSVPLVSSTKISSLTALQNEHVRPLNDRIKRQVYQFYGTPPAPEKLPMWIVLLQGLSQIDSCLEIFTTNYDIVLEEAIEHAQVHVNDGLDRKGRKTRLDLDFWKPPKEDLGKRGLLTKLHGSVDWQRENGAIIVGSSRFTDRHENHCLLYPGYKGVPDTEPFISFHDHLRNVVRREYGPLTAAVFVGFAFRDEYINTILAELPSETPVFLITKLEGSLLDSGLPLSVPFSVTMAHSGDGLTEKTAAYCLSHLHDQIKPPLDTSRLVKPHSVRP